MRGPDWHTPTALYAYVIEASDWSASDPPVVFDLFTMALSVHAWNSFALMTANVTDPAAS